MLRKGQCYVGKFSFFVRSGQTENAAITRNKFRDDSSKIKRLPSTEYLGNIIHAIICTFRQ